MSDEQSAILAAASQPSSPTNAHYELATPSMHRQQPHDEDAEDAVRLSGQQQDAPPPHNPQSSTEPSANTAAIPTGPGQAALLAVHSALTHNPVGGSATQKADSERTADLKQHSAAANMKQTAIDSKHDVQTADTQAATKKRGGKVTDDIDPEYALDAIPSLDDYIRYVQLLQDNWRDAPIIDIVYNDLSYVVQVSPEETRIPSISRSFADFFRWVSFQMPKDVPLAVFHHCTGVIPHGQMTLLLAPPGAGKSQFLKTLAGRMRKEKRVTGELYFNGLTADEQLAAGQYIEKLCGLIAQGDVHFSNLTVRETLKFAVESCVADPSLLENVDPKLIAWHRRKVDLLLSVLGMHECADTIAGNAVIRGISGGQKKRLTIGEFMITNSRVLLLDEPTTGLDAAVARDIMVVLRKWCGISGGTVISALLQPTPECYELYDNVILMKEGNIVYQGPRQDIPHFLWHYHGLEVAPDADIADFLVDWMTDPALVHQKQQRRWSKKGGPISTPSRMTLEEEQAIKRNRAQQAQTDEDEAGAREQLRREGQQQQTQDGYSYQRSNYDGAEERKLQADALSSDGVQKLSPSRADRSNAVPVPSTAAVRLTNEDIVAAFHSSPYFAEQQIAVDRVHTERQGTDLTERVRLAAASASLYTREQYSRRYARSYWQHTKAALNRQFTLIGRDKQTIPPRFFSSILIAVILGSLFFRLGVNDFYGKFGMLLFALLNSAMGNFTELPAAFEGRNAVYKHLDAGMYPALSYLFAVVLGFFPVMLIETILFSIPLYFMVGLAEEAGRFFFFFLVLLITDLMLAGLYRGVCYTVATIDAGQQVLSPVFNMMIVFGGFLITRDKIPDFLIEFYWLTPISWAMRSLVQNEFFAGQYDGNGDTYLLAFEVQTDPAYKWAGVGYLVGFMIVCLLFASYLLVTVRFDLLQGTKRKKDDMQQSGVARDQQMTALSSPSAVGADRARKSPSRAVAAGTRETVAVIVQPAPTAEVQVQVQQQVAERRAPSLGRISAAGGTGQSSSKVVNASFSIPFQPMALAFDDLHYTVKVKTEEGKTIDRKLLNGISGYVKPGQLTALMGASGAGKTTLMDVIAGRKTAGKIQGTIAVNGQPQDQATYRRISAYVEQNDAHLPLATVRESMLFSARLRLPQSVPASTREAFVDELISLLELDTVKDRIVGNENYVGLSPGQLKLLTIGVELVSNPSILFLDEPTSGLDSRAALVVMRVVKNIAATGRTVLCTIHQPSSEVFYLFDYLLLLKSGGETVYFGPLGDEGAQIVEYFEHDGLTGEAAAQHKRRADGPRQPEGMNPASWMLDVIGAGVSGALSRAIQKQQNEKSSEPSAPHIQHETAVEMTDATSFADKSHAGGIDYAALYASSALCADEKRNAAALSVVDPSQRVEVRLSDYHIPAWRLLWLVLHRGLVSSWRDSKTNYGRVTTLLFLGIMFGLIYLQINASDYAGVNSKLAAIFSAIGFGGMLQNQLALPNVIAERAVYYRERASDSYSSWMYSVTLGLVEVPYVAFSILVFITPYYFMVGFNNDASDFFKFYLAVFMLAITLSSLGQWAGATFPSFVAAIQASGMLVTFWFLFGGVFLHPTSIPRGWLWFYYVNPIPKGLIACALPQFQCHLPNPYDNDSGCPTIQIPDGNGGNTEMTIHAYMNQQLNAGYDTYGNQIGYLVAFYIFFRILCALSLKYISHQKR